MRVRPRVPRAIGALWLVAGAALSLAGLVVLFDQARVSWELPVGVATVVGGWWLWARSVTVDGRGIEQVLAWHRTLLPWSATAAIAIDPAGRTGRPVVIRRDQAADPAALLVTVGTTRAERTTLLAAVRDATAATDVRVVEGPGLGSVAPPVSSAVTTTSPLWPSGETVDPSLPEVEAIASVVTSPLQPSPRHHERLKRSRHM